MSAIRASRGGRARARAAGRTARWPWRLSGGLDSTVAARRCCRDARRARGPSPRCTSTMASRPHADAGRRSAQRCRRRGVPLAVEAVAVTHAPPAGSRRRRGGALRGVRASGRAPHALHRARASPRRPGRDRAAAAAARHRAEGPRRRCPPRGRRARRALRRPLLGVPRVAIDEHARAARVAWIEDESNARHRHRRNAVRHVVMPALARGFFRSRR